MFKKYVAKVTLLSVLAFIAFCAVSFVVFANASPLKFAHLLDDMGMRSSAVTYAEKAYNKSGDIADLDFLLNVSIKAKNNEKINKYSLKLIEDKNLSDFAGQKKDAFAYYDYVASQYITSGYNLKIWKTNETVLKAMNFSMQGYRKSNAVENLILCGAENNDVELLEAILIAITEYESLGSCPEASKDRLHTDVTNLSVLIERVKNSQN